MQLFYLGAVVGGQRGGNGMQASGTDWSKPGGSRGRLVEGHGFWSRKSGEGDRDVKEGLAIDIASVKVKPY